MSFSGFLRIFLNFDLNAAAKNPKSPRGVRDIICFENRFELGTIKTPFIINNLARSSSFSFFFVTKFQDHLSCLPIYQLNCPSVVPFLWRQLISDNYNSRLTTIIIPVSKVHYPGSFGRRLGWFKIVKSGNCTC